MKKLVDLKLIKRTKIVNRQGRGHALKLEINYTAKTKRLIAAIRKATPDK
jgi:hypothetical protein